MGAECSRRVETQQKHLATAVLRRSQRLEAYGRRQAECQEAALVSLAELRAALVDRANTERATLSQADSGRLSLLAELRGRAEHVKSELAVAGERLRHDERWLLKQLAAEAAKQRQLMDAEFEAACAQLRDEHSAELAALREAREKAVTNARTEHSDRHAALSLAIEEENAAVMARHEEGFQVERVSLEERREQMQEKLAEARAASAASKEESAVRQRLLDEMARELQDSKRRAQALSSEADQLHERRFTAEQEARELRRQRAAIERALGGPANAAGVPQTERALAGLSEEVRSAQTRLGSLRNELDRTKRLLEQRRSAVAERGEAAERLSRELVDERRRADELQRALLRLEGSA